MKTYFKSSKLNQLAKLIQFQIQESIKLSLKVYNNNHLLLQKLNTQVTNLTRRFNEKDYPSFINVSITVLKFHFNITTSQEDKDAFMEDQRLNIDNCKLQALDKNRRD
ncbi:hypothetical protein K450DRAFT_276029 [Umbelopsis ramanniana AG]|uniref:Uncharacterized protein n=1 Tax=Umbelopsis ramanniana AG TaxID=1314678 RepID=A0AAD5DYD8_UMBRA|nr:uncharacterized protein K450DRAFT_276029 [Umbelopsis ramanniana AG]KAI8574993.1 hypothetical protein K450DRAFT_276029 [Umbelopsis ramanniana AG]